MSALPAIEGAAPAGAAHRIGDLGVPDRRNGRGGPDVAPRPVGFPRVQTPHSGRGDQGGAWLRSIPLTLAVSVLLVLIHLATVLAPGTFDALVLSTEALANGEAWRIVSGNLLHLDATHLGINLGAFAMLGSMLERRAGSLPLLGLMFGSALAISTGVVLDPGIGAYCGLSGILNAVFAALCAWEAARRRSWGWALLLAGGLAKIAWEWSSPALVPAMHGWPPHTLSHLVGYACGLAASGVMTCRRCARAIARTLG